LPAVARLGPDAVPTSFRLETGLCRVHRSRLRLHYHLCAQLVEALGDVFVHGYYADKVIAHRFKDNPKWGARDRRFFAESFYEIVRWWRWHWHLAGLPSEEYVNAELMTRERAWLVFAAYWTQKVKEVPYFDECRSVTLDEIEARQARKVDPAIRASMPDWLNELGKKEIGFGWPELARELNRPADVFLRANTVKIKAKPLLLNLAKEEIVCELIPDLPDGLHLPKRENVFATSAFRAGLFEVQDGASQMVAPFLQPEPGMLVVDACAGAGGKALHLACLMKNQGRIVGMDIHEWKLKEMQKRFRRNKITIIDPRLIQGTKTINGLHEKADRVLLDVPCSGLGVLRRNPDTKWKLSPAEISRLIVLQAELLSDYSRMTKPGGKLVYATCSVLPSENGDQVRKFLDGRADEWLLEDEESWYPNRQGFDGFYAARLVRRGKGMSAEEWQQVGVKAALNLKKREDIRKIRQAKATVRVNERIADKKHKAELSAKHAKEDAEDDDF
jgi:16S rRNA (cytosine967-C5)-methyltransferase